MQQQYDSLVAAVKGASKYHKESPKTGIKSGSEKITIKMPTTMARGPKGKMVTENNAARNNQNQAQTRGGNDQNQILCYNCQGWGHMQHKCSSAQNARPLNFRRGTNSRTSPSTQTECRNCASTGATAKQ